MNIILRQIFDTIFFQKLLQLSLSQIEQIGRSLLTRNILMDNFKKLVVSGLAVSNHSKVFNNRYMILEMALIAHLSPPLEDSVDLMQVMPYSD